MKPRIVAKTYYQYNGCLIPFSNKSPEQVMSRDMSKMLAAGWRVESQESIFNGIRVTYVK